MCPCTRELSVSEDVLSMRDVSFPLLSKIWRGWFGFPASADLTLGVLRLTLCGLGLEGVGSSAVGSALAFKSGMSPK